MTKTVVMTLEMPTAVFVRAIHISVCMLLLLLALLIQDFFLGMVFYQ
jgi:hypothetical protein